MAAAPPNGTQAPSPGQQLGYDVTLNRSLPAEQNLDDGGFLLANAMSFGGQENSRGDLDFDMEWAYYALMDEDNADNGMDPSLIRPAPQGSQQNGHADRPNGIKRKAEEVTTDEGKKTKGRAVWRKYGQKTLKGKDYTGMKMLRCYYRCNHPGCQVKKQVETSAWSNEAANITIHGIHNHPVEEPREEDKPIQREGVSMDQQVTSNNRIAEPKPTPPLDQGFADLVVRAHPHFVVADPHKEDCPIIFASAGFEALTGYPPEETLGRNCRFLQGKDTNRNAVRQLTKAIKANREIHIILLNYKKDGTPFWNLLHISPIIGVDGTLHSIVGAQLDVSGFVNQGRSVQAGMNNAQLMNQLYAQQAGGTTALVPPFDGRR